MEPFFFYGTLLDADLRAVVLGARPADEAVTAACLAGYRRVCIARRGYPALISDPRGTTQGELVRGLDEMMAARISYYESDDYGVRRVTVECRSEGPVSAWVFLPARTMPVVPRPWDLEVWRRRFKARAMAGARSSMAALPRPVLEGLGEQWRARRRLRGVNQD